MHSTRTDGNITFHYHGDFSGNIVVTKRTSEDPLRWIEASIPVEVLLSLARGTTKTLTLLAKEDSQGKAISESFSVPQQCLQELFGTAYRMHMIDVLEQADSLDLFLENMDKLRTDYRESPYWSGHVLKIAT